jgi:CheY-like chemotaxis protein
MDRQLGHLSRLVDDLIDVSRITQGKIALRTEHVELASIIHHAVEASRPLVENARHELSIELPVDPIYLEADPIRLAQVFSNLLNNAAKYTQPGGRIRLAVEREGPDAVVTVTDTGIGIPADKLDSVFDMFTQVDRSLEPSQSGLGLGLTLAKRLVEMHDGAIEAYSEGPARGSRFTVRLPVLDNVPQAAAGVPVGAESPLRRFLVVDDNKDAATSLAMLLSMTGNETQVAYDGVSAIAIAEQFRPSVILLDIGLPKMSGLDACRRIREQPWGQSVVIVALTGWGQDDDRRKSADAGFDYHMVKPVDYVALMNLLDSRPVTNASG